MFSAKLAVGLSVLSVAVLGQAPLLQVSAPQAGPHGWQVVVTNNYSARATAFVIDLDTSSVPHKGPGPPARHAEDSIPGPAQSRLGLDPGTSRIIGFGPPKWEDISYTNSAVVYADGATAGDSDLVGHILKLRQFEVADIEGVMPILAAAGANSSLDVTALITTFSDRKHQHELAFRDGLLPPSDRICGSVLVNLQHPLSPSPAATISGVQSLLVHWLAELDASKPVLVQ